MTRNAWRAIAALRRAEIGERVLQRMQAAVGRQALHGRDVTAVAVDAEHQTRQHRLSVEQHRARAALAELAAVFRAGQIQVLTQHLEERLVRGERDLGRLAVDGEGDVSVWGHKSIQRRHSPRRARRRAAAAARRRGETSEPSS